MVRQTAEELAPRTVAPHMVATGAGHGLSRLTPGRPTFILSRDLPTRRRPLSPKGPPPKGPRPHDDSPFPPPAGARARRHGRARADQHRQDASRDRADARPPDRHDRPAAAAAGARGLQARRRARSAPDTVALVTGEEKIKPDQPRYWICTVEAMPRDLDVAFVAIDEIQLAADLDRGHVFTDRLLQPARPRGDPADRLARPCGRWSRR